MTIVRAANMELTDEDVARAAAHFGIDEVELLGGFENVVYRSTTPTGRILRLTHPSRRSVGMIRAELAFMEHLSRSGVPVVAPICSRAGDIVEELVTEVEETVVVACMTEASGGWRRPAEWSDSEIESYGSLLGAMHSAAGSFRPPEGATPRPPWTHPIFDVGLENASGTHPELVRRGRALRDAAAAHPAGAQDLLIHRDAHTGNLFATDAGGITVFDFDDCAYGTAVHDVAIVLFYWLTARAVDPAPEARRFLSQFLRGYERQARLPTDWPQGVDLFLSHRELDLYWLIAMEHAKEHSDRDRRFMEGRLEHILEGVPYLHVPLADVL